MQTPIDLDRAAVDLQARGVRARTDHSGATLDRIWRRFNAREAEGRRFRPTPITQAILHIGLGQPTTVIGLRFDTRALITGSHALSIPLKKPYSPVIGEPHALPFDASDAYIREKARFAAALCYVGVQEGADLLECVARARNVCRRMRVEPPTPKGDDLAPMLRRMCCQRWWRRRLRSFVARTTETHYVTSGLVHRTGQLYASNSAVYRRLKSAKRNGELLRLMQAVNENGEVFTLDELADSSTSNPVLRRNELMVRIKGLEATAAERGDVGMFVTLTLPSRFHSVNSKSGRKNPRYDGSTPDLGARFLSEQWKGVRARLAKRDIKFYGLRVAEPHADATPHWHMLIFCTPAHMSYVKEVLHQAAFSESPDESGAAEHRIKFVAVDAAKGSAIGYIAKYIAKNIDGFQLGSTQERGADGVTRQASDNPAEAAERIVAWKTTWRIRQFQFFGTPPIAWWRELRRLAEHCPVPEIEAAREPADAGEYARHVAACGGVAKKLKDRPLSTYRAPALDAVGRVIENAYGELLLAVIKGVATAVDRVITRLHVWRVIFDAPSADRAPWTRVNNCNRTITLSIALADTELPVAQLHSFLLTRYGRGCHASII